MKIVFSKISNAISGISEKAPYIKTRPYPNDSVHFTAGGTAGKKSFMQKLRSFFGLREKLNAKSFADGSHTPKGPYVASRQSVAVSDKFLKQNYLSENDRIVNGFRDGGRNAGFTNFGETLYADREVLTIDREKDVYLDNLIKYVHKNADDLSEKKKMKFLFKLINDISGDRKASVKFSEQLGHSRQGEEVLLGKVFEHGAAVCRHKGMLMKILGDEIGLKTRLVRGNLVDIGDSGGHVWNEVKLSNGKRYLFDTQQNVLLDMTGKNAGNNYILSTYYTPDNHLIYK